MTFSPHSVLPTLRRLEPARRFLLAFSGGLDSTVLLHALCQLRAELNAELVAVHVNHRLQPAAGAWAEHCRRTCEAWNVPYMLREIDVRLAPGVSPEAAAREARYAAFESLLEAGDVLLTAQHQDDQLETFLLQLLRGAGLPGLAAMPAVMPFGAGRLARPLLDVPRVELAAYAVASGLQWIDDPSNRDTRFDRNWLRHELIPLLKSRWPAVGATVSRAARHCAAGAALLGELAREDLAALTVASGERLDATALAALPAERAANVLRHWLAARGLPMPPERKLAHVLSDVLHARADRQPCVRWPGGEVRRHRGVLYALRPLPPVPAGAPLDWSIDTPLALGAGLGTLLAEPARGMGLSRTRLGTGPVTVRFRGGGERIRPVGHAHHKALKKLLQEAGIVPWMRSRIPLVYAGTELAAVGDLWIGAEFAAQPDEPSLTLFWRDHPPLH